ncbi:MAG: hypothetical protein KC731_40375, partial [Myxococcales bacterium]|nr:hypothetical protein [Myxococcales bacterium]
GGETWLLQYSNVTYDLTDVVFVTPDIGFSTRLKTADGGKTWSPMGLLGAQLYFDGALDGWGWGGGQVWRTTDGGESGESLDLETAGTAEPITNFAVRGQLVVAETKSTHWRSTDGGTSWTSVERPPSVAFRRTSFVDEHEGWAVTGGDYVLRTENGGTSWTKVEPPTFGYITCLDAKPQGRLWLAGYDGSVVRSSDAGITWELESISAEVLNDITFVDGARGWTVGGGGSIFTTIDGGVEWLQIASFPSAALKAVRFVDASLGWVVGRRDDAALVARTVDGGETWAELSLPCEEFCDVRDVDFWDPVHGMAIGGSLASSGLIWRTSDGGETWTKSYQASSLSQAGALFGATGALVGSAGLGKLLRTEDLGATWSELPALYDGVPEVVTDDIGFMAQGNRLLKTTTGF